MRFFKVALTIGLVAGIFSCKPKMDESVVKSVSDGTFRFGKMTSASIASMRLVEFKLCHSSSSTCFNPFINKGVTPSVRASFLGQNYDAFDQRKEIDSIMKSIPANVQATERLISKQNDVLVNSRRKLSIATQADSSATQEVLTATNGLNNLKQQAATNYENNVSNVQHLQGSIEQLMQKLSEARNVASLTVGPEPKLDESAMSITTIGSSKPTVDPKDAKVCQCGATPTRFFLAGHIAAYRNPTGSTRYAADPSKALTSCDGLAMDPPDCRMQVEVDEKTKAAGYSKTQCICLYGIGEDKANRKFKNERESCNKYEVDPEVCVNPEDLAAHKQKIKDFESAREGWAAQKAIVDKAAAALKELNEVTIPKAQQDLAKTKTAASSQTSADKQAVTNSQAALARAQDKAVEELESLNTAKESAAGEDAKLQRLIENLAQERANSKVTPERLVAQFKDSETGYNGKLILASPKGRATYVDDWNKAEASAQLDSVSDVILAIAELYNFELSCRLWGEPFLKIGNDIGRFAPKAIRQCEKNVEGDWALDELMQAGAADAGAQLASGVYRHPDMEPMSVRKAKDGGYTLSTLGATKTAFNFATCEAGKCVSDDQTIVVMGKMNFGIANPKTKEIYYFATSEKDLIKEEPDPPAKTEEKAATGEKAATQPVEQKPTVVSDVCKCSLSDGSPSYCLVFKGAVTLSSRLCTNGTTNCCTQAICNSLLTNSAMEGKKIWIDPSVCNGKVEMRK